MTPGGVARRYATALFDVAARANTLEAVERALTSVVTLVTSHEELWRLFQAPAVPASKKRAVVDALVASGGPLQGEVARLLGLLADRDRLAALPDIARAFADRLLEERRLVPAEIVTATPLDESRQQALVEALGRATGRTVTVTTRVDPSIIGGVVARVGSLVFDGSVTRQLERMREALRRDA